MCDGLLQDCDHLQYKVASYRYQMIFQVRKRAAGARAEHKLFSSPGAGEQGILPAQFTKSLPALSDK